MLRVFVLCAERLQTPDNDISDAYCQIIYEGRDEDEEEEEEEEVKRLKPTEKEEI